MGAFGSVQGHVARFGSTAVIAAALALSCCGLVLFGLGPLSGHYRVLTVLSGSMQPVLPVGSVVIVTPRPLDQVHVGDIITFQRPDQRGVLETHRVVRVLRGGAHPVVLTKGDANPGPDPWRLRLLTGPEWRVRMVVPRLGYALTWWSQPLVRVVAVVITPLVVAALVVAEIWGTGGKGRLRGQAHPVGIR